MEDSEVVRVVVKRQSVNMINDLILLKEPAKVSSSSLQSPYDPDATYGHKGKGYEAQISETCEDDNPYQLITGVSVNGANESDQRALLPMLDLLAESGI
jgi:hypothetical protein